MQTLSKKIVTEWNIENLSEQERIDFVSRVGKLIYQAVLVRSLDILSDVEEGQLDALLDRNETTPEDVLSFLQKKIPTFNLLLQEEIESLKKDVWIKA